MATVYGEAEADIQLIRDRRVAIVGYGNQGHAHALNLRDSGCDVRVGARRDGGSWAQAEADGFLVETVEAVSEWGDVVSVLLPDQLHRAVYDASIKRFLSPGKLLILAHGSSLLFGEIAPPSGVDATLLAPVGPGHMMRRLFLAGGGEPALLAVQQDATGGAERVTLSYAAGLGCTRAGVVRTTIREETVANLFAEQAVLCGGVPNLMLAGYQTLVEAGYGPEVAYIECVQTTKLIVDLIYEGGFASMRERISDTAEFGGDVSGPRIVDDHVRASMRAVLREIEDGTFTRLYASEYANGLPMLRRWREEQRNQAIEAVGEAVRGLMRWVTRAGREGPSSGR